MNFFFVFNSGCCQCDALSAWAWYRSCSPED